MKTTDLCDEFIEELQVSEDLFQSFGKKRSFHGPIYTVKVYEDNVLVRRALETIPAGAVLIVDGGGSKKCALLGDRLAEIAVQRGIQGIIINGCVRDTKELATLDIGILALGKNPVKSRKEGKGDSDIPVHFAAVNWIPRHIVYADKDGVVVASRQLLK
ncbi:ribonuclease E activity regulator RraA [Thermoflavimicrobium daqui]|jgi:regulator of ribonuclease activity A|uniref:4-hydroxy-4-methyl-2-oxoglutarate aldolase n=1 Tax=Thermoflavimicrobium daqui TaxID=2137476 RepID=A0A364K7Z3_9BACL|nr:ribonuclease E activity regulator RraA [Thermoflavimicrobium daqui]RAL26419.1 S-adenosylmethionine--2-demethylmenaquinone methyltransferase [Thermoflavimicrobium daqui]